MAPSLSCRKRLLSTVWTWQRDSARVSPANRYHGTFRQPQAAAEPSDRFQAAPGAASLCPRRIGVAPSAPPALLPVTIADPPASPAARTSSIEIVIANAIVRIDCAANTATVPAVLQGMRA